MIPGYVLGWLSGFFDELRAPIDSDHAARQFVKALETDGLALVQLSEPDGPIGYADGEPKGLAWRYVTDPEAEAGGVATVAVSGWSNDIIAAISCLRTPDEARWAAAALLAAASAAEAVTP